MPDACSARFVGLTSGIVHPPDTDWKRRSGSSSATALISWRCVRRASGRSWSAGTFPREKMGRSLCEHWWQRTIPMRPAAAPSIRSIPAFRRPWSIHGPKGTWGLRSAFDQMDWNHKGIRIMNEIEFQRYAVCEQTIRRIARLCESGNGLHLTAREYDAPLAVFSLSQNGPVTVSQLAEILLLPKSTTSRLVSRLRDRGLVLRDLDAAAGASVGLRLSRQATQLLNEAACRERVANEAHRRELIKLLAYLHEV